MNIRFQLHLGDSILLGVKNYLPPLIILSKGQVAQLIALYMMFFRNLYMACDELIQMLYLDKIFNKK